MKYKEFGAEPDLSYSSKIWEVCGYAYWQFKYEDNMLLSKLIEHFGITKEMFSEQNDKNIEYILDFKKKFPDLRPDAIAYTEEQIDALFSGDAAAIREAFRLPMSIVYNDVVYTHFFLFDERIITHDELLKMKDEVDLIGYLEEVKKYLEPYEKDGYSRRDNYEKVCQLIDWLNGKADKFPEMPSWSY